MGVANPSLGYRGPAFSMDGVDFSKLEIIRTMICSSMIFFVAFFLVAGCAGAILKYDEEKGFGFIKPDRGSEALGSGGSAT